MRFGSIIFWLGFVGFLAMSVIGYEHYYKGLRAQEQSLQKATNQLGSLKQDIGKLRKNYDTAFGVGGGKTTRGVSSAGGAGNSGAVRTNANKRIKELEKRMKGMKT